MYEIYSHYTRFLGLEIYFRTFKNFWNFLLFVLKTVLRIGLIFQPVVSQDTTRRIALILRSRFSAVVKNLG